MKYVPCAHKFIDIIIKYLMKRSYIKEIDDEDEDEYASKRQKMSFDKYKEKYNKIRNEMRNREITMGNVLELDLPMEEYIWFSEYLDIYAKTQPCTEERYKIGNTIYKRYENLKNVDVKKLNKIKTDSGVENDIICRILNSSHPDSVKAILYKKYKRYYDSTNGSSDEFIKVMDWIDNVLDIPLKIGMDHNININQTLIKLWKSLNNNTHGLNHVKEKIMEVMCAKLLDPDSKGRVITLVGPPGVGKTTIAVSIAESLSMPFDQISFGSVKDSSVLTGHSSTYVGSVPGLFATILLKSKRLDTVILLDEIDKIQPNTAEGRSVSSVLLHVLDKAQNNKFRDLYMPEVHLDLSKILFICAANSLDEIDPVLRDRMTVIEMEGYDVKNKIDIVKKHLFPKIRGELGFSEKDIILSDSEIEYMIKTKTENQPGMRDCEKKICQLCERLALLKSTDIGFSYKIDNLKFPLKISNNIIDKLLKN